MLFGGQPRNRAGNQVTQNNYICRVGVHQMSRSLTRNIDELKHHVGWARLAKNSVGRNAKKKGAARKATERPQASNITMKIVSPAAATNWINNSGEGND